MTDTNPNGEIIDMAAVWADDEAIDSATSADAELTDAALSTIIGGRRANDATPLDPIHTAALERAIGRPIPSSTLFGGAR